MTTDQAEALIAFYSARLDEDEVAAKGAVPGPWRWADWSATFGTLEQWRTTLEHSPGSPPFPAIAKRDRETTRVLALMDSLETDPDQEASAEHIVRQDPACTLRRVEAGHRLIRRYELAAAAVAQGSVVTFISGQNAGYAEACLDAISDAAAVWDGHPDYDPAWRMEP